jgi:lipoic acid synthetase
VWAVTGRLPPWFKKKIPPSAIMVSMRTLLNELDLNTVCESALCPNIGDCFSRKTATFLIMGDICTRKCSFCAVSKGVPAPLDEREPEHLAEAVAKLGLKYVVITSVTRDDLPDGGSAHFVKTITRLRESEPTLKIEVLIPDFTGSSGSVKAVVDARPDVVNHNLETVPRLYPEARPGAEYERSLRLLRQVKEFDGHVITKSGVMVGLGETKSEIVQLMKDLRKIGCDLLTLGQYLQPSSCHHPVIHFIHPEEFEEYEHIALEMGFRAVASAPLVRSSFDAAHLHSQTTAEVV